MNWIALLIAGIFEIGWPLGLKLSQQPGNSNLKIGAIGTFAVGILYFGDSASMMRLLAASLIVIGIVGLKFASLKETYQLCFEQEQ